MLADIENIAKLITATRHDFSQLFLRAQYNLGISVEQRNEFEAIVRSGDDRQAFREALEWCKGKTGLYDEVVNQIVKRGFDGGALLLELAKEKKGKKGKNENVAPLQAIVNSAQGWMKPDLMIQGFTKGRNWTGKVLIDGTAAGSGVLIGPKRFLTAWHVVMAMFDEEPGVDPAVYKPKKNPPALHVVFDDYDKLGSNGKYQPSNPITIEADEEWLEVFSTTHMKETQNSLPDPQTEMNGYWDYAIIRLSVGLDNERNYAVLEKRAVVPDDRENILLFQYPNGNRLLMDIDEITSPNPPNAAVPEIRFLHQSNAAHGSSGGPCFDREFYLIGLHQGVWMEQLNGRATNRGVPIRNIIQHMENRPEYTSASNVLLGTRPEDYYVWYTDKRSYDPVIGVDDLQFLILNNIRSENGYILSVQGEKGSGKTFCIHTIIALLCNEDHLKIVLPAEVIAKLDAVALARYICAAAGAELAEPEKLKDYNTTTAAWLRDEVTPKVITALEAKRNKRLVWLCITNLNVYDIDGENTAEFLLFLYASVVQNPWLQFILDGNRSDIPSTIAASVQEYFTKRKTEGDIKAYISRFLQELKVKADQMMIDAFTNLLYTQYAAQPKEEAMAILSAQSKTFFSQFMKKISEK